MDVSSRFKFSLGGGFRSTERVSEKLPDDQKNFVGVAEIFLFRVSCFFSSFFLSCGAA